MQQLSSTKGCKYPGNSAHAQACSAAKYIVARCPNSALSVLLLVKGTTHSSTITQALPEALRVTCGAVRCTKEASYAIVPTYTHIHGSSPYTPPRGGKNEHITHSPGTKLTMHRRAFCCTLHNAVVPMQLRLKGCRSTVTMAKAAAMPRWYMGGAPTPAATPTAAI